MNDPAVAVKFAVVAPAIAMTDAGTEMLALLELTPIDTPEPGAAWLRVTTQVEIPLGLTQVGLQLKPLTNVATGWTIAMLPPLTETGMLVPAESERITWATWIAVDVLVVPGARVKVN